MHNIVFLSAVSTAFGFVSLFLPMAKSVNRKLIDKFARTRDLHALRQLVVGRKPPTGGR